MRILALSLIAVMSFGAAPAVAVPDHNPPWFPSLMASEHYDSGRTHLFEHARFGGSYGGRNQVDVRKAPGVYPLTRLVSAALSTKAPESERTAMADLLGYVGTAGQVPGEELGQLPEGHAPLTPAQIHAMPVEATDLASAATQYAATLAGLAGSPPVLDLVHR